MNEASILLTPGPLTTSDRTRAALDRDWGSRERNFMELTRNLRERLLAIVEGNDEYTCIPLQGSGTFAMEASLGSLIPPDGKLLIIVNGVYGRRMGKMCDRIGRPYQLYETPENVPPDPAAIAQILAAEGEITHVSMVHCETTSGMLNPLEAVAKVVAEAGCHLLVDAMSSFGIIPFSLAQIPIAALMASANKGLEGVPGLAFVICRRSLLVAGQAHSLALDLHDQWEVLERTGQWRYTPPTQVLAALMAALEQLDEEGGVKARYERYRRLCEILRQGMEELGFEPFLPPDLQAPAIVTFKLLDSPAFSFEEFYRCMGERGFVIYPGKLTDRPSFRIGCMGAIAPSDMHDAIAAAASALDDMGNPLS
ncbi:MAG: 2-aminoethylphosphonate--pyruvate transaminase [Cyanobacteria bacterium SBLK]|nr:2-aminoethylphosphonate--pyruvate transaminase [Cyanobacteria bacterium SBLK]